MKKKIFNMNLLEFLNLILPLDTAGKGVEYRKKHTKIMLALEFSYGKRRSNPQNIENILGLNYERIRRNIKGHRPRISYGKVIHNFIVKKFLEYGFKEKEYPYLETK